MKIILYKDVLNLGEEGDVKTVADGYARNYLIPQKLAVKYTKSTEIELAQKQQAIARRKKEKSLNAADLKTRIEALEMDLAVAAGDKGKLFGSVTSSAVVDYLQAQGIEVERKKIELPDGGIKIVGSHTVRVKLYGGEEASLKVNVSALSEEKEEKDSAPRRSREEKEEAVEKPVEEEGVSEEAVSEEPVSEDAVSEEAVSEEAADEEDSSEES